MLKVESQFLGNFKWLAWTFDGAFTGLKSDIPIWPLEMELTDSSGKRTHLRQHDDFQNKINGYLQVEVTEEPVRHTYSFIALLPCLQ